MVEANILHYRPVHAADENPRKSPTTAPKSLRIFHGTHDAMTHPDMAKIPIGFRADFDRITMGGNETVSDLYGFAGNILEALEAKSVVVGTQPAIANDNIPTGNNIQPVVAMAGDIIDGQAVNPQILAPFVTLHPDGRIFQLQIFHPNMTSVANMDNNRAQIFVT